jgi:hypothetical protein
VSSIGSVPEPIAGVPLTGELSDFASWDTGALRGLSGVFGLGNVLTGKGNIKDSRDNAEEIATLVVRDYLGLNETPRSDAAAAALAQGVHEAAREQAAPAIESAIRRAKVPVERLAAIAQAIEGRWLACGYGGSYKEWIARHKPSA